MSILLYASSLIITVTNLKSKIVNHIITLIECIPNFSEARRPEVIDQIVAAIQSVGEVKFLDRSSDLDHNRTVLTFAGAPDERWDNDMLHLLDVLTGDDFEAVDTSVLMVDVDSGEVK